MPGILLPLKSVISKDKYGSAFVWGAINSFVSLKWYSWFFWTIYSDNCKVILFLQSKSFTLALVS